MVERRVERKRRDRARRRWEEQAKIAKEGR
jgi:hypothetical protein